MQAICSQVPRTPVNNAIINNGQVIWIDFANNIGLITQDEKLCIWKELQLPPGTTFSGTLQIEEWTTIHKKVGGEFIGVDTTALLLAGIETNAITIIGSLSVL